MISPTPIEPIIVVGYIELGASALIIQMLIAGGIGALIYFRAYLKKAKAFLRNLVTRIKKGRK